MTVFPLPTPSLVGRERELDVLKRQFDAALAGRGSLALIGGEAGIGKTALAESVCREAADRGALVLIGHCYDLSETPPYGPWVELFGQYQSGDDRPALPAAFAHRSGVGETSSQAALFNDVRAFITAVAVRQPLVLLLDDLHWADPASLDLLRFLSHSLALLPLLIVATYRADEINRGHPLYHRLPMLERESPAMRLDLRRLPVVAIQTLVALRYHLPDADAARLVAHLDARAEGNAFFVTQLLRAIEEEDVLHRHTGAWTLRDLSRLRVPIPLRQVIDGRLARLGEQAHALLAVAAVIGQEVPLAVWTAVIGGDEDMLSAVIEHAVAAHLLEESADGASVRFVHALVRAALYEGVVVTRRRIWHRRVAEALIAMPHADPDAVAYHFQQAGDPHATDWLIRAGEHAERTYALRSAIDRFNAAAALLEGRNGEVQRRGWLLLRVGWLRRNLSTQQGFAPLQEAQRLAREAGDPLLAALAAYFHGQLLCWQQQFHEGLAESDRGVAALAALPADDRARLRTLPTVGDHIDDQGRFGSLACWRALIGRFAEAQGIAEQVVGEGWAGTPLTGQENMSDHYAYRALAIIHAAKGDPERARLAFARARAIPRLLGEYFQALVTAADELERHTLPYHTAHSPERRLLAAEITDMWARNETAGRGEYPNDHYLVALSVVEGRWDAVQRAGRAGWAARSGTSWFFARRAVGEVAQYQGDATLLHTLVTDLLPLGPETEPGDTRFLDATAMQRAAAGGALDQGDLETAQRWLEAHDRWLDWSGALRWRSEGHALWGAYCRVIGDAAAARRHASAALATATKPHQPLALLAAHRLLGELETDAGNRAVAETHLAAALTLSDACAASYERALTLLAFVALHLATGDTARAAALLDQVRAICAPLDAKPALTRADALAARLAAMPPPAPVFPDGLSAREVDVLRLIAGGGTNQEIAATLSLSVRTVERHITGLYRKIDGRGRADAIAYALRHALVPDHPPPP